MSIKISLVAAVAGAGIMLAATPSSAAPVITTIGADVSVSPYTFDYKGSTFTIGFNGDYFGGGPLTISSANGGEVNTIFGQPTTNFVDRGTVTFGPNMQYAAFDSQTPIRFTNGDNFFGLRSVTGSGTFYGFAYSTNNVINSIGFEDVADATITATTALAAPVPEPAAWALMILGFGLVGSAMRRRNYNGPKVRFA